MRNLFTAAKFLLLDLASTIVFMIVLALTHNVMLGIGLGMALGVGQIAWALWRHQKADTMQWMSLFLVLAGGGATAVVMMRGGGAPRGLGIHGVTTREEAVIDGVHVYASGALTPAQLHGAYWGAFVELRTRADSQNVALVPPIQELVAIPRAAFCEPTAYPGGAVPSDCASLVSIPVALSSTTQRLLVIDEPSELTRAMQRGVAEAICVQEGLTPAVKKLVCTIPDSGP